MSSSNNDHAGSDSPKSEEQSSLRQGRTMFGRYRLDGKLGEQEIPRRFVRTEGRASSASQADREIAHHRHWPKKHAPLSMLAKIGRSIKVALIKAEAVIFPHPGKDRNLWDWD
jgi:hypothetical protein